MSKICTRKKCIHNGKIQPYTNFSKHKRMDDGYQTNCKDCFKELKKLPSQNNKTNPNIKKRYTKRYPIPQYAIYRIFDGNKVLMYVGETTQGGNRIREHLKSRTARSTVFHTIHPDDRMDWNYDYVMDCTGMTLKEREYYEAGFIKHLKPWWNEDRPKTNLSLEDIELILLETKNGITNA